MKLQILLLLSLILILSSCGKQEPNFGDESETPVTINYENELEEQLANVHLEPNPSCKPSDDYARKLYHLYQKESEKITNESKRNILKSNTATCVREVLKERVVSNTGFHLCQNSGTLIRETKNFKVQPCQEDSLIYALTVEIEKATSCFGINKEFVFSILYRESRLQPLITSKTYAAGVGQLTKWPVREVNNHWEDLVEDKAYGSCSYLAEEDVKIDSSVDTYACSRISLKEGLRRNIVYSVAYILRLHRIFAPKVNQWLDSDTHQLDKAKLLRFIIRVAYNGGPTLITNLFNDFSVNKAPSSFASMEGFESQFISYARANSTNLEILDYNKYVKEEMEELNSKTGLSCGKY